MISSPELSKFPVQMPQALENLINGTRINISNNTQSMDKDMNFDSEIETNLHKQNQLLKKKLTELQESKNLLKEQNLMLNDSLKDSILKHEVKESKLLDVEAELQAQKEKYDKDISNLKSQLKYLQTIKHDFGNSTMQDIQKNFVMATNEPNYRKEENHKIEDSLESLDEKIDDLNQINANLNLSDNEYKEIIEQLKVFSLQKIELVSLKIGNKRENEEPVVEENFVKGAENVTKLNYVNVLSSLFNAVPQSNNVHQGRN
ncbi:hypothetical protein HK096_011043, partial [Nowakowskiella sp. JEL0078]